ncbi:stalk domain-containing protein [Paenibacillus hexagrammi]|uniref:Copper amine oxidase n=1 Tax=Paenibacillus hexagrammi TaxID=2908839 RepID=A0ABY3SF86_9BACL|nr:stalk domain-containing protein [Paenibacillus sp. YPD9-1]UJF31587.1 copper amine oxidase [Paenibacillus sp. YPD9-1]
MKPLKHLVVSSITAAALLTGSSVWAAELSGDALYTSQGQIMSDVGTHAGIGDFDDINGKAAAAAFRSPSSVAQLPDGGIIVADTRNHMIRKIKDGQVTTFAGPEVTVTKDEQGFPTGGFLNGKASESFFNEPSAIAVDGNGNVYVADAGNHAIRKIDTKGQVTTLAGNGVMGNKDGKGTEAQFDHPTDLAVTTDGIVYVADTLNHEIRKITPDGTVSTLNAASTRAIQIRPGAASFAGEYKDGALSVAKFNEPSGIALDSKGNLYVSDTGNQRIRYVDLSSGTVKTVAGFSSQLSGNTWYDKDELYVDGDYADGQALKAKFNFPKGLAVTSEGGLLIADSLNHSIRYLLNDRVSTIAGQAKTGESDGVESAAAFYNPTDVIVTEQGNLVVADAFNNKIRKILPYHLPQGLPDNGEIKVVNGNTIIQFDAQPELSEGRTMVPVRAISEALGYEVKYTEANGTSTIQLIKGDVTVELYIGRTGVKRITGNQPAVLQKTDAAPYISQDRTYVPIRFFAEQIGLDVEWDDAHKTVILRTKSYDVE